MYHIATHCISNLMKLFFKRIYLIRHTGRSQTNLTCKALDGLGILRVQPINSPDLSASQKFRLSIVPFPFQVILDGMFWKITGKITVSFFFLHTLRKECLFDRDFHIQSALSVDLYIIDIMRMR